MDRCDQKTSFKGGNFQIIKKNTIKVLSKIVFNIFKKLMKKEKEERERELLSTVARA